jgi:hypothetical protein
MRFLALALGVALTGLAPSPASGQTPLLPGDKLSYETVLALGFESLPRAVRDPCAVEMRVDLGVAAVDAKGMDVDVEISVGVRAVRYSGPTFSWALEPATPEGFITRGPTPQEGEDIENAPLSRDLPPLAQELVRKELSFVTAIAMLHDRHATARISAGPEPFVRIDYLDLPVFSRAQHLAAERYLRAALLLAFPPVPLDLRRDAERYAAGGSIYEVLGERQALWPIRGRAHRVRSLEASSAARAAFAFEAVHDTGLEPADGGPRVSEWSDVHAPLGIAGQRHIRVVSPLAPREGGKGVTAVASWHADLVKATRTPQVASADAVEAPRRRPARQ